MKKLLLAIFALVSLNAVDEYATWAAATRRSSASSGYDSDKSILSQKFKGNSALN